MDVRDGFIVGIFNYCDRRCEACAFTSRCRLFAMSATLEAILDPNHRGIAEAPAPPEDDLPPLPRAVLDLIDAIDEPDTDDVPTRAVEQRAPPAAHDALRARAEAHRERVWTWLQAQPRSERDAAHVSPARTASDAPLDIVAWSHLFIAVKLAGLLGMVESAGLWDGNVADVAEVADGSAKVVLLAIERAHAAWLQMAETGRLSSTDTNTFIADLIWMHDALECLFPRARAFVRPAFDEPDEVARLHASEGSTWLKSGDLTPQVAPQRPDPTGGASET